MRFGCERPKSTRYRPHVAIVPFVFSGLDEAMPLVEVVRRTVAQCIQVNGALKLRGASKYPLSRSKK